MSVEAVISTQVIDTTSVGRSLMTAADAAAARTAADAQVTLVSGTNIKTVNSTSLLGSGDIVVSASPGGSTTEFQYNNAGAFGGTTAMVYAATGTHVVITSQAAATVPLAVKGAAGQSGNLAEWRNSSGTLLGQITSAGDISLPAPRTLKIAGTGGGTATFSAGYFGSCVMSGMDVSASTATLGAPASVYTGGVNYTSSSLTFCSIPNDYATTTVFRGAEAGSANVGGGATQIAGGRGKGTGVGGSVVIQTAPAGSAGSTLNALVTQVTIAQNGLVSYPTTVTAGGTTGNQTINKLTGTVNIAAAGTTVTVTNSLVSASSIVLCVIRTGDTTARIANVVPASGSFTINIVAATAEVSIGFLVVN